MRQVTEQELLDISFDEYKELGYFDQRLVAAVWEDAGRVKGLPDEMYAAVYKGVRPYSQEGIELFKAWLKEEGASYYADDKENFNVMKAVGRALREGNKLVYVENLS